MVVCDKQTNGVIYTPAQLLAAISNVGTLVSPLNLDNKYRFRVLYDKCFTLSKGGIETRYLKWYREINSKIRYGGNAGDITDLDSVSYSIFVVASEPTNEPSHTRQFRIRFVDN